MFRRSREDQRIYANIHGSQKIKNALAEAAKAGGWQWLTGRLTHALVREEFRRGHWTIFVEWTEGGHIAGAAVYQTQPEGVSPLRCGMIHRTRDKKAKVLRLLVARDDDELMKKLINDINNEMAEDRQDREAKAAQRTRDWDDRNFG